MSLLDVCYSCLPIAISLFATTVLHVAAEFAFQILHATRFAHGLGIDGDLGMDIRGQGRG